MPKASRSSNAAPTWCPTSPAWRSCGATAAWCAPGCSTSPPRRCATTPAWRASPPGSRIRARAGGRWPRRSNSTCRRRLSPRRCSSGCARGRTTPTPTGCWPRCGRRSAGTGSSGREAARALLWINAGRRRRWFHETVPSTGGSAMYTHILIATDGSALAGKGRATRVRASDPWQAMMAAEPSGLALGAELREEQRRQKEAQARAILDEGRERAARAGIELETVYVPECPADEAILETATKIGADLIVMASHGHRGLRKLLLGSQTQAVVSRGHLPVLVVR